MARFPPRRGTNVAGHRRGCNGNGPSSHFEMNSQSGVTSFPPLAGVAGRLHNAVSLSKQKWHAKSFDYFKRFFLSARKSSVFFPKL